jgi:hypothetical protein
MLKAMDELPKTRFQRCLNSDASYDSVCQSCFLTIATECAEAALEELESVHSCTARAKYDLLENLLRTLSAIRKDQIQ